MKQFLLAVYIFTCLNSCSSSKHNFPGIIDTRNFDSSVIIITKADRLAYVDFLNYKTITHRAGKMSAKGELNSPGIISAYRSTYHYGWQGEFMFVSLTDSIIIKYISTVSDELTGNYALISPMRRLNEHKMDENHIILIVTGNIYQPSDSTTFLYSLESLTLTNNVDGYFLYKNDSILFKRMDTAGMTGRLIKNKLVYGLYEKNELLAALDFTGKHSNAYVRKDLPNEFRNAVAAYLSIVIGNQKIITRRGVFLKRLI